MLFGDVIQIPEKTFHYAIEGRLRCAQRKKHLCKGYECQLIHKIETIQYMCM